MNPRHLAVAALAAAVPLVLTPPATAQQRIADLAFGVPADAHVFIHGVTSATPDPAMVRFERALAHLVGSRVHEDLFELMTLDMSRRRADEARMVFAHVLEVLSRADWATLMREEVVFAERLALPMPEYVMIVRVPADEGEALLGGIRSMFAGFAEMAEEVGASVRDIDHRAGKVVELGFGDVPFQFSAGLVGDAIVLATGTQSTIAALRGLGGDGRGSIAQSAALRESVAGLPKATEATTYVDFAGLMGFIRQAIGLAEMGVGNDREAQAIIRVARSVLEDLDVVEHMAATTASDGTTVTATSRITMRDGYEASRLTPLFANQQPWADWHRFVPADATSFVFDSGVDIGGLFDYVAAVAAEAVGDGQQAPWSGHPLYQMIREKAGFVSGEVGCVTFPAANDMGCDSVLLLRLESTDGVAEWLGGHLNGLARVLAERGQQMTVTTNGTLHEVELAAFPWIRPVIGVRGGLLVAATSPDAIARVQAVHDGQAPDIRKSERFASLGIGRGDRVPAYVDYGQIHNDMAGFANLMSAAGFFMSLLPEDRDTRPVIKVGAVLTKLAPALRELDMAFDVGIEMVPMGDGTVMGRTVYRYRDVR